MILRRRLPMQLQEFEKLHLLPLTKQVTDMGDKNYDSSSFSSTESSERRFVSKKTVIFLTVFLVIASVCIALLVYYCQQEAEGAWYPLDTNIRLPSSIHPVSYELWLQPFINGNFSLRGTVEILMNVTIATSNVTLHINDIITYNETVAIYPADDPTSRGVEIKKQSYDPDKNFYIVKLEEELKAGQQYVFHMEYEGLLNDRLVGFYRSSYVRKNGTLVWLASTQFQPTEARRAFPCFDEPALKATFTVHIARQRNMTAIANMPKIDTTIMDLDWVWDHFNTTLPMSTYLVAIVVSDYESIEAYTDDGVTFKVWAREEALDQTWYASEKGPQILAFFEEYFSIPFPLPKLDMIAVPDFSESAMENWGLITYREAVLLLDPLGFSSHNQEVVAEVIAHELAHQWFGDLVTMEWWSDLWLNEGFATYLSYLGTNWCEPDWNFANTFVISELQTVFAIDCYESSHPVSAAVEYPSDIEQLFDDISYAKGASIIRMMHYFLTDGTFRAGLTNYLNKHRYSNAAQDDLWVSLTDQGHADGTLREDLTVKTIMDSWTLQEGYPVVNVELSDEGEATISQKRFLMVKSPETRADYKWWIPITYTTQESPDFTQTTASQWLSNSGQNLVIKNISTNAWHFFNLQQTGYYRVNYGAENWQRLADQLNENLSVIDLVSRAQLIDDSMDLARAGELNYSVPLTVNSYLTKEREFVPWSAALNNLAYLEGMFTRTGGYVNLRNFLLELLVPLYEEVGFEDDPNDSHEVRKNRVLAVQWACALEYEDCVTKATALYRRWMEDPRNETISENLKPSVYCTAIARGSEHEWNFAWSQYGHSNIAFERGLLLKGMACSREIWILSRLLEMAFTESSGIRRQDASFAFNAVAINDVGRDLAWNFLRKNVQRISDYLQKKRKLKRLIRSVSVKFNHPLLREELQNFKEEYKTVLQPVSDAIDESIDQTSVNIAWMDANYDTIVKWLRDNGY